MNFNDLISNFQDIDIIYLFFKAFAVLLAFLYLIYALVILKQTQVMNRSLNENGNGFITLVSFVQLIVGLILVILAIFTV